MDNGRIQNVEWGRRAWRRSTSLTYNAAGDAQARVGWVQMDGPHLLLSLKVDQVLAKGGPGFYMLGDEKAQPRYVGRADDDLRAALKAWAQSPAYHYFWFERAEAPRLAYEGHCYRWHELGGGKGLLDNREHPASPSGAGWWCPVCGER